MKDSSLKTNAGSAQLLDTWSFSSTYLTKTTDRVSDLLISQAPGIFSKRVTLKNITLAKHQFTQCNISSPWLDAKRTVTAKQNDVQIEDTFTIKEVLIPNPELKSAAYSRLQAQLEACFYGVALVFNKNSSENLTLP